MDDGWNNGKLLEHPEEALFTVLIRILIFLAGKLQKINKCIYVLSASSKKFINMTKSLSFVLPLIVSNNMGNADNSWLWKGFSKC